MHKISDCGFRIADSPRGRGFMVMEMVVSMGLMTLLLAGLAVTLQGFRRFNHVQWTRQQCLAAAEAQLDSLAVQGRTIAASEVERLWPGVRTDLKVCTGTGQWEGLVRIEVSARAARFNRPVQVSLSRYVGDGARIEGVREVACAGQ